MAAPGPGGTAVELRSADFSPPPLGTCKSAGSGMNSALQVRRNWLNSTAVRSGRGEAEPHLAMRLLSPALSSRWGGEGEETTAKRSTHTAEHRLTGWLQ